MPITPSTSVTLPTFPYEVTPFVSLNFDGSTSVTTTNTAVEFVESRLLYQPITPSLMTIDHPNISIDSYDTTTGTVNISIVHTDGTVSNTGTVTTNHQMFGNYGNFESHEERMKKKYKGLYIIPRKRKLLNVNNVTSQETKARNSLRDMISERDYRRYLTNSFVVINAPSGLLYQVFNNQQHIHVYERGKKVSELCIHTDRKCPPSDHIINMKVMIEFDEKSVWLGANAHRVSDDSKIVRQFLTKGVNFVTNEGQRFIDEVIAS